MYTGRDINKRKFLALCMVLCLMAFSGAKVWAVTLNLTTPWPERMEAVTSWEKWFAKELDKRTNGKFKIKIFWSESLGKTSDFPDLVQNGGADLAMLVPGFYPARFPLAQVTNQLWFINNNTEEAYAVAKAIYWQGPIPNEFAKQNMKLLYVQVLPPYQLWSHKAIKSVDDMKGLRIRSWGPYMPRMYSAVGATGVTLVAADWFEAMQKRMTDGGFWSVDIGMGVKVEEVAKFVNMVDLGYNTGPLCVMNLDRWKGLPNDVKEVINQLMAEMPSVGRVLTDKAEQDAINKAKSMGITFVPFEGRQKWIDLLPDLRAQWQNDMQEKGLGKEATEIIKLWDEALKNVRKK